MATGLLRQSSYGSLSSLPTPSKGGSLKKSSSLSSIVSGTSELGYSVASRSMPNGGSGAASSIKASMMGRRPDVQAVIANSRQTLTSSSIGVKATSSAFGGFGADSAKRSTSDLLGSLPRSFKGNGLLDACMAGDLSALRMLVEGSSGTSLSKPDVNSRDGQGRSALMLAVTSGSRGVVEYLIGRKADVNAVDSTRKGVLHHASKRARGRRTAQAIVGTEQIDVVALLLRSRAVLEAQDSNGCTPLMLAVANSDPAVVEGLLRAGACVDTRDSEGQTCLDYAVSFELSEIAQLLKRAEELRRQPLLAAPAAAEQAPARPRPVEAAPEEPARPRPVEAAPEARKSTASTGSSPTATATAPTSPEVVSRPTPEEARPVEARPAEAEDAAAEEKARRKAEKKKKKHAKEEAELEEESPREVEEVKEKKKKKHSKEVEPPEAGETAEEAAKREAEEAAERERKKALEKAEAAQRAAEELAKREAEERGRLLDRLQSLIRSSSSLASESAAEELMKELKAAIKAAQAAGIEEQHIQEAETCAKDLKNRSKAMEKLKQAIADRDLDKLRKAIAKAEEANVPKSSIDEAKAVVAEEEPKQQAKERLAAAKEAGSLEELKAALAAAAKAGVVAADLVPYEQVKANLERRAEAEAALLKAIESRDIDELKAAIQQATEAGVDGKPIKQAEKVLKEEEPKQRARQLLREACQQRDVQALRDALQAAEAAKLSSSECTEAAEILKQEEEKLKALESVNKALEDVKGVDMANIDALREAKEKLGSAIQDATKAGVGESHLLEAEKRRKKIHNSIEDLKGSIRVFCRIRPLSSKEKDAGDEHITKSTSSMSLAVEGGGTFSFDAVFTPGTQEEVFEDCRDLVQSAVDGYNVTMFAYGQTGAGKTFTMYGAPGMEGTAPRTIKEIYRVAEEGSKRFEYEVRGSMLELYRNDFVDLLNKGQAGASKSKLNVRVEKSGAVTMEGLIDEECKTAEELSSLLERGNEQRTVACTAMNSESSRSHLVLIIKIKSTNRETKEQLQGKILICDLAGSERIKKSQVDEEGQKEAIEINKSLTALGDVIEALTKGEKKIVPYRNHKLTQLMQDSLGGTSKTLMFVNCSPASSNLDETVMSLKYATRAKKITNTTKKGAAPSS